MHMVAANVYVWIASTVTETQHEFLHNAHHAEHGSTTPSHHDDSSSMHSSHGTHGELVVVNYFVW